ncbi:HD domain protein, cyanamide hydratase family [Mycobacterium basiliense]|uniref:HD domain protein, cyanamide hydratase family n=1 Tax=Mycobacterium basiliense TaxID=2094119 RepID=A0A447GBG2_9MYCO|nr:cyanamide hydratase [Mycobacterium basiliense]VDM87809.1 HD domain protein, cyanamide hydratase family [Mycobacterium basiliense]
MFPNTPAAAAALTVANRCYTPSLRDHCIRSYLWGAHYAATHRINYDDELLYVSAMLHDMALTDVFDSHTVPFENAGGELAWVFGIAAGWTPERAARAAEIIVLHMRDAVAADVDPESHLLQVATAWDVVGLRPEEFPLETRAEVLARYPRQDFVNEFLTCFENQAARKPGSATAVSVFDHKLASLITTNPLD